MHMHSSVHALQAGYVDNNLHIRAYPKNNSYYSCTNLEHVSKQGKIGWHRGAQHSLYFYEHGEEVPVCDNGSSTAAVQQQRSSSSSTAEAAAGAVRWRRRRCRPRQHGKPFFAQLSQQHRGPPEGEERPLKKYGKTHHYPA